MGMRSEKLRIGEISYANCTPIYTTLKAGFDCGPYEFVTGEPSLLNAMLARGEVDVSASSSIEYARHADEYLVIPDLSISSSGEVGSILFFSKRPIEDLGGREVAVSSASATSTVLLKVLLRFKYGIEPIFRPRPPKLSSMLGVADAALLIGDAALRERIALPEGSGLFVYDLGREWDDFTGLPFVYALWMIRADSAGRLREAASGLKRDLLLARDKSMKEYGNIALAAPESAWMGADGLVSYWRAMSYRLEDSHIEGLMRYLGYAKQVDEIPAVPVLKFF